MRDKFWMENDVRVESEDLILNRGSMFQKPRNPALNDTLSFMDPQINEFIIQGTQYSATNTGSQYLDPAWRQKMVKINPKTPKRQMFIS